MTLSDFCRLSRPLLGIQVRYIETCNSISVFLLLNRDLFSVIVTRFRMIIEYTSYVKTAQTSGTVTTKHALAGSYVGSLLFIMPPPLIGGGIKR